MRQMRDLGTFELAKLGRHVPGYMGPPTANDINQMVGMEVLEDPDPIDSETQKLISALLLRKSLARFQRSRRFQQQAGLHVGEPAEPIPQTPTTRQQMPGDVAPAMPGMPGMPPMSGGSGGGAY